MNEKPLERLNYFNGQRLQASDFKLEQDYHMRVRRWLNRSLYSPGIASGLEVYAIKGAPNRVRVMPGLAIDHLGREIILREEQEKAIEGGGEGTRLYLTIRYQEDIVSREDACCAVGGNSKDKLAWGAPSRILAEPVLEFDDELPHKSSAKIALACLTLGTGCASLTVDTSVRRYIGAASAAKVGQYALEGIRDIDSINDGVIRFHIRGREPSSVTLYLRGERFPTYFYTELGSHSHAFYGEECTSSPPSDTALPGHKHTCGLDPTTPESLFQSDLMAKGHFVTSQHSHTISFFAQTTGPVDGAFAITPADPGDPDNVLNRTGGQFGVLGGEEHKHAVVGNTNDCTTLTYSHTHPFTPRGNIRQAGSLPRADLDTQWFQTPLLFVSDLKVDLIQGRNGRTVHLTNDFLRQVKESSPTWENRSLGDGSDKHVFVTEGTGPVRIDLLPNVVFAEGEYEIRLVAPSTVPRNGGRIHFNLYVE